MASTRLPGKTLRPLLGESLLFRVAERICRARCIDGLIVATTRNPADDCIEEECRQKSLACYRGSEEDVLGRVVAAGLSARADVVVQLGADCPFYDPALIDELVGIYLAGGYDYVANDMELTYPEGVDAHVVGFRALEEVAKKAVRPRDREDVPRYIWDHPQEYRIFNLRAPTPLYAPHVRLTLDYPEDWALTEKVYEALYPRRPDFSTTDVLDYLGKHPEVAVLNAHCRQLSAPYVAEPLS